MRAINRTTSQHLTYAFDMSERHRIPERADVRHCGALRFRLNAIGSAIISKRSFLFVGLTPRFTPCRLEPAGECACSEMNAGRIVAAIRCREPSTNPRRFRELGRRCISRKRRGFVTTWKSRSVRTSDKGVGKKKARMLMRAVKSMERTTGFEPATPTLARSCSTS